MRTLVLGLGNELLGDDAAGILAARALRKRLAGRADVMESSLAGIALLDLLVDYDRVILIDCVKTNHHPPGTLYVLGPQDLDPVIAPSPHYAGLPELLAVATALELHAPRTIRIFALEVEDPYTVGAMPCEPVRQAIPRLVERVCRQVQRWEEEDGAKNAAPAAQARRRPVAP